MRRISLLLALAALTLAGCAFQGVPQGEFVDAHASPEQLSCRALLVAFDEHARDAGVTDAQYARVAGFPHLRVDRMAAAGFTADEKRNAFAQWVALLRENDRTARGIEAANLGAGDVPSPQAMDRCAEHLMHTELSSDPVRQRVIERATVPDAYLTIARVLGLYPLTTLAFSIGIAAYQEDTRERFATPLDAQPAAGTLTRYDPPAHPRASRAEVAAILDRSSRNALSLPLPTPAQRTLLFATFAPTFDVDVLTNDDRIGAPRWKRSGEPGVDWTRPTVYRHVSHARSGDDRLLQLNYVAWFAARPLDGPLDLLGGALDGVTLRVTLGTDGAPIMLETMHNCGCYHMFMPGAGLLPRALDAPLAEPPLIVQRLPPGAPRAALRIAHSTHYVVRAYAPDEDTPPARDTYALADYDALRSLRVDGGRRSLFAPDGLVRGSERGERWLFWPMGVPSAGAMRQWGHHAIAFAGTRHFDDPLLMDVFFERR